MTVRGPFKINNYKCSSVQDCTDLEVEGSGFFWLHSLFESMMFQSCGRDKFFIIINWAKA